MYTCRRTDGQSDLIGRYAETRRRLKDKRKDFRTFSTVTSGVQLEKYIVLLKIEHHFLI